MSKQAQNFEAIHKARAAHDQDCPGEAERVLMHPYDVERMGWEDGDVIVGLKLVSDEKINTGMLRVECDLDVDDGNKDESEEIHDPFKYYSPDMLPSYA